MARRKWGACDTMIIACGNAPPIAPQIAATAGRERTMPDWQR